MGFIEHNTAAQTWSRLIAGLVFSLLIGIVAYRRGSLTRSGVAGTVLVGTLVYGFGGWIAGILLMAFFVSSTALSHYKQNSTSKRHAAEQFEKGGTRDVGQVLANGGAAALFALGFLALWWVMETTIQPYPRALGMPPGPSLLEILLIGNLAALVGSLATVNADTWATELGVLSRTPPRSILTFQPVEPGASGGISLVGTLAALGGSSFIAVLFLLLSGVGFGMSARITTIAVATLIGGFIGAMFDSLLGATVQSMYFSQRRQKLTEKAFEADGTPNQHTRGLKWLTNDWVNFISSLAGALVAAVLANLLI